MSLFNSPMGQTPSTVAVEPVIYSPIKTPIHYIDTEKDNPLTTVEEYDLITVENWDRLLSSDYINSRIAFEQSIKNECVVLLWSSDYQNLEKARHLYRSIEKRLQSRIDGRRFVLNWAHKENRACGLFYTMKPEEKIFIIYLDVRQIGFLPCPT